MESCSDKRQSVVSKIVLWCFLPISGFAQTVEYPEMIGTWTGTLSTGAIDQDCGASKGAGELDVFDAFPGSTSNSFRSKMTIRWTTEKCPGVRVLESNATLTVRGNNVTIIYNSEGWDIDSLYLDGATMAGVDTAGTESHWVKLPPLSNDERVEEVKRAFAQMIYDQSAHPLRQALSGAGLAPSEVEDALWKMSDGFAQCMIDAIRAQAVEQSLPILDVLNMLDPSRGTMNHELMQSFDMRSFKARSGACNAGVSQSYGMGVIK